MPLKSIVLHHLSTIFLSTTFKNLYILGSYEKQPGVYHHVYFNCTSNTIIIYILLLVTVILTYEMVKNVTKLVARKQARISMVMLLATSLYPNYYTFWVYFNAFNDDFYKQVWHQAVFSVTELVSSYCVYHMCNRQEDLSLRKLLAVISIAIFHISSSAMDQFVSNVLRRGGKMHQISRDIGLMVCDIIHLIIPTLYLISKLKHVVSLSSQIKKDFYLAIGFVATVNVILRLI